MDFLNTLGASTLWVFLPYIVNNNSIFSSLHQSFAIVRILFVMDLQYASMQDRDRG